MVFFNQTKNALRWSMSGVTYSAPPYGPVEPEVPDVFVYALRGLPLGEAPVARDAQAEPARLDTSRAEAPARVEKPKGKPRAE